MPKFIENHIDLAISPLFLPTLMMWADYQIRRATWTKMWFAIGGIERQTGHAGVHFVRVQASEPTSYQDLNLEVSKNSQHVSIETYTSSFFQDVHDNALSFVKSLELDQRFAESFLRLHKNTAKVRDSLAMLISEVHHLRRELDLLKQRCEVQQRTLYNFIAREDAQVNIRIADASRHLALASKRDSASMKTMAVVTMAFLPGTFAAAFCMST